MLFKKIFFIFLLMVSFVRASDFTEWKPEYNLWMPSITSRSHSAAFSSDSRRLPFDEPKIDYAPSPVFERVSMDPWKALQAHQPFFATPLAAPAPQQYLVIDGIAQSVPVSNIPLTSDFMISKSAGGDSEVISAEELSPDNQQALRQAFGQLSLMPGEYTAHVVTR